MGVMSRLYTPSFGFSRPNVEDSSVNAAMEEVSAKVLTETRRGMERDGLIERNLHPVATPQVEYGLTEIGRRVLIPLQDLCHRAKAHRPTFLNATPPASGMTRSNWARSQTL